MKRQEDTQVDQEHLDHKEDKVLIEKENQERVRSQRNGEGEKEKS